MAHENPIEQDLRSADFNGPIMVEGVKSAPPLATFAHRMGEGLGVRARPTLAPTWSSWKRRCFPLEAVRTRRQRVNRTRFMMANSTRSVHSYSKQITEDIRKSFAELGRAKEEPIKRGLEVKSKESMVEGTEKL